MVEGVKSFQRRHGLDPDGVVGPATFEQLQVTPAARAVQIALTMERLRWTPLLQAPRMVVVNIPEFVLRVWRCAPRRWRRSEGRNEGDRGTRTEYAHTDLDEEMR